MSKKANPTVIGAFVVGAVVLGVAAVLVLGGGTLFHRTHPYVLYFRGDINGLAVGSPVKFLGVRVGSVKSIRLRITPEGASPIIPVTIVLDEDVIERKSGVDMTFETSKFERMVDQGLRARLEMESLVTGQRYVALLIDPSAPLERLALEDMDEIPTMPATLEEMHRKVEQFLAEDLEVTVKELGEAASALRTMLASPDAQEAPATIVRALDSLDSLATTLEAQVQPIGARVEQVGDELTQTLASLQAAAERTQEVEGELSLTLSTTRGLLSPDSPLAVQLQATLQEFAAAARSLRSLAELVERDPSALLRGKDLPSDP
jgi:paraquat-inducible protein B